MDDRVIRADWDAGFIEGRQYGRGKHGGQVRDEYRKDYDPERGGYNRAIAQKGQQNKKKWKNRFKLFQIGFFIRVTIKKNESSTFFRR